MSKMTIQRAADIVLELAQYSVLDESDAEECEELAEEREKQMQALSMIEDHFATHINSKNT